MNSALAVAVVSVLCCATQGSITCPDGRSVCPDGTTCCVLSSGAYGCCPLPRAVCCSDHLHCCPSGTTCDLAHSACTHADGSSAGSVSRKAVARVIESVRCNDGSECPDGSTCCRLASGAWGCCPLPRAVCCADHVHCCPHGTRCDTAHSTCTHPSGATTRWHEKQASWRGNGTCSDDGAFCGSTATCCHLNTGDKACCPLPRAVCCADEETCCPFEFRCKTNGYGCESVRHARNMPAMNLFVDSDDVQMCPDGSECGASATCCPSGADSHAYSCCLIKNATCCSSGCCPSGFDCEQGKCSKTLT